MPSKEGEAMFTEGLDTVRKCVRPARDMPTRLGSMEDSFVVPRS